jgi:hypothetical protein
MSNLFKAVKPALTTIDALFTRTILLFWISTLLAQQRHARRRH